MGIFDKRLSFKPYEYPEVLKFREAIRLSRWDVEEYDFDDDVQDFKKRMSDKERNVVKNAMLAISQIEAANVKTFWANIGNVLQKPEISMVGLTMGENECYDDKTEVLTNNGYKFFKDLDANDKVATYNISTKEIIFEKPSRYIVKPYKGLMHHYKGRCTDLMITPNHSIIVEHPSSHKIKIEKSSNGTWGRNYLSPVSGIKAGNKDFTNIDRLKVAIQGDGSLYGTAPSGVANKRMGVSFNLTKTRKVQRLKNILDVLNIDYKLSYRGKATVFNFSLKGVLTYEDLVKIKTFDYINIEDVDYNWGRSFIEELMEWDGSKNGKKSASYYNSRLNAIEKVACIATISNYRVTKAVNRTAEETLKCKNPASGDLYKTAKDCYVLTITDSDTVVYPYRNEVAYDGMVYCVTMSLGTVVVRRNKHTIISGNCTHSIAYSQLLEVLGFNEDFQELLKSPVIEGRVNYLNKYLSKRYENNEKFYTLSLMLFTLFVERVSLFSQFAIIKSFRKKKNYLKSIDNVVLSTQKDELVHSQLGVYLLDIIKKENPDWFNEEFYDTIYKACEKAFKAEKGIIEWIFEKGDLDFITKDQVIEFTKDNFNTSLESMGLKPIYKTDKELLQPLDWFNVEIYAYTRNDFFNTKSANYNKISVKPKDIKNSIKNAKTKLVQQDI